MRHRSTAFIQSASVRVSKAPGFGTAGVGEQQVEGVEAGHGLIDERGGDGWVGDIAGQSQHRHACLHLDAVGGGGEIDGVAAIDDDVGALTGEEQRGGIAQAAAGPGDKRNFAL